MTSVIFKIDKGKDIDNWYDACNSKFMGVDWKQRINSEIRKKIVGKTKKEAVKFLKVYLEENYYQNKNFLDAFSKSKEYWNNIEPEVFKRIEKITGRPIWPGNIVCYISSFPRGHYHYELQNDSAYMLLDPINFAPKERFCRSIVHEILHFQVHRYFWEDMRDLDLTENQIGHIKEATTFLLNEEFLDLFKIPEKGYELHWKLREDMAEFWRQNHDFLRLLEFSAKLLRERYIELK